MNQIERNIIVGSLLGDGSLALYGRSKNAHYREHGGDSQIEYRKWKATKLANLGFKFSTGGKYGKLSSPSSEIFTELYKLYYQDRIKTITHENIKLLDHPIGLACLYMDDGSLVINSSTSRKNGIYIFPQVLIYSLCFSKEENIILCDHIKSTFDIEFSLKNRPDGKNFILQISKRNELMRFITLVKPYVDEIDCMKYKVDVKERLIINQDRLEGKYPNKNITVASFDIEDNSYSKNDELTIQRMKKEKFTDKEIAAMLNRPYWGIVDKIRRMRKNEEL
ncbi:LAGLIDADG DNA endonuclease [Peptoclostridium acidaminophilum DSM 3953]|uniref:LAGLIDADG DNA endonuclease n=1 Tax=Peptoclostridium acidaminophilum DSM 3953 TaxID=1286171 RepID=W8T1N7_PEPAC|nr:hypothetical protein [Peptoclostridium acidaminophilum]AHM55624.1 LAGLIDADG DNA endonuclease [Peptoclostridium acidaminophilum DSM 3953]